MSKRCEIKLKFNIKHSEGTVYLLPTALMKFSVDDWVNIFESKLKIIYIYFFKSVIHVCICMQTVFCLQKY